MKKYVLFGHGGSGNHGCEALVRSTYKIFNGNGKFYLYSKNPDEDRTYGLDEFTDVIYDKPYQRIYYKSRKGIILSALSKLNKKLDYDHYEMLANNKDLIKKGSVAISIGGDNYCYRGVAVALKPQLFALNYKKIPAVLWGCSVGKEYLTNDIVKDIKKYSLITARESLTVQNLYDIGIKDNVIYCSDPAFTLDKEKTDFRKDVFDSGNVIGLNVSNLMSFYESYKGATIKNFIGLVKYLLQHTDSYIALIPHVKGDGAVIEEIVKEVPSERIVIVGEEFNCMQLKYLISKCKIFIGCRTHSTIAAYSTCVPTLVVGYSVKSQGIAKDIFGSYDGLVVDGRKFDSDDDLTKSYLDFIEREKEIKNMLTAFMPEYIQRAYNGKEAVNKLFK